MPSSEAVDSTSGRLRADAQRNQRALLAAAAEAFVASGIDVPVREIAARAGVGIGTIYRHFPTRADLVVGVYRHQVDDLALAGPALLGKHASPFDALSAWVAMFVDFLVTKHGLASALNSASGGFEALHKHFLDALLPVCTDLLAACERAGAIVPGVNAYELMRAIGNLCIALDADDRYDARRMVDLLLGGLRNP